MAEILADLRALVARVDNDFARSWWDGTQDALSEVDGLIAAYERSGEVPPGLGSLFLPTSGLQELAIGSGWGNELNALADRYDALGG